ncbi:hypothetical protein JTE90_019271 [Oedothorax gibbosus]|uniref:DUF5641 domain-containing protein n=1 Tax=Oedothorax gibbosus TaxID=931172 RepID=A0AAV6UXI5_9ARAC|nr:hypothetical protein JTE90_019271 [Oedothorax gibbosus]
MQTALCNCEDILNERPLTTVSSEATLAALRPADFTKEIKSSFVPDVKTQPDPNYLRRRIRYLQTVREASRVRFRQEYLGALCTRYKNKSFRPLKEGDVVLIGDDNKKRVLWPLGLVIEARPGTDGIVRRVKLKTQQGELYRAAQRLYHLEVSSKEDCSGTKTLNSDIPSVPFETLNEDIPCVPLETVI